jgi:hypothetical protein
LSQASCEKEKRKEKEKETVRETCRPGMILMYA